MLPLPFPLLPLFVHASPAADELSLALQTVVIQRVRSPRFPCRLTSPRLLSSDKDSGGLSRIQLRPRVHRLRCAG